VTQQNTANAEETAAAAEELSGQARELNSLLARFELRPDQNVRSAESSSKAQAKMAPATRPSSRRSESIKPQVTATKAVKKTDFSDSASTKPKNEPRKPKPSDIIALDDDEFGRY
jgi:methyl-accepting chemotaxis protein